MKIIRELDYKPHESFMVKNICNKPIFTIKKNDRIKLIKLELIIGNDIIADKEESIFVESRQFLTNLFDEFFIVCKNGNVSCYGCFE